MNKKPRKFAVKPQLVEEPSLGPGPTLDQPTAPPAVVALSEETQAVLSWIAKEEAGERNKLAGLEALAERQRDALRGTLQAIEQSRAEIQMAQGSRFAVVSGVRAHLGLPESYQLRGNSLTCLPE